MMSDASPKDLSRAIVAATADALIAVDTTGAITAWNQAAERLLGHPAADALGQTLALIIPAPARPLHISGFHRAMETGQIDTGGTPVSVVARHANGTEIDVEMVIGLIRDEAQHSLGAVAALRPAGPRRSLASYAPAGAAR